jgi:PA14 domain/Carbohydrate binding domain
MRMRIVWLTMTLLLGFVGLSPVYAQPGVNILPNGGFESGAIAPYGMYGTATSEVVTDCVGAVVPEGPVEGKYCLHIVVPAAGTNNWDVGMSDGSYTFEKGKKYTFSAFLKCKSGTLQFRMKPERAADPYEGYGDQVFTMTDTWQEFSVTTPVFTETVTPASPTFHLAFAAGDFWIDNVRLYEGDYVAPGTVLAHDPDPADGSTHTDTWASLSWTPGDFAASHDVYFGDNFDDVNSGAPDTFYGNQPSPYFVVGFPGYPYPDGLVPGTTYYWRIDEVNENNPDSPWKGKVWSFLVPPTKAFDPSPADTAKFIGTDVTLTWSAGFNARLHHIYFGDNAADVDTGAASTDKGTSGKATYTPSGLEAGTTYYWRIDEFDGTNTYKGDVWSFTTAGPGGGIRGDYYKGMNFDTHVLTRTDPQIDFDWLDGGPDPAVGVDNFSVRWTGEVEAAFTETYTFYAKTDDGVRLYVDGQLLIDSWVDRSATEDFGQIDLIAGQTYSIVMEYYENTGGASAQLSWSSPRTPKQVVPQAALSLPVKASSPSPRAGSVDVPQSIVLTWGAGQDAASHEVYFGTDANAVRDATKTSPEYKGSKALGDESYDPGKLAWATTYYWRVDEVNSTNPGSPWVGNVWSFTTADFLVIDDFESYNSGDNQIWYSWHDGLGYGSQGTPPYFAGNGTGAAVGDETTPSFTEETIVHGGKQSMPFAYDNNKQGFAKYSEAQYKLTSVRDWTQEGITQLSLWYRGLPGSVGSFTEAPAGTYTMTASGTDIWDVGTAGDFHDEFHFAYKMLSGPGSIVAKVESVQNTDPWAKAGVMIRETLDGGSKHAFGCVTPGNGVASQGRVDTGGASFSTNETGVTAPHWVKLERDVSGLFTVSHSADGKTWVPVAGSTPTNIQMASNVYIGLAVTAHNAGATCQAVFSNVTTTGTVTGQWAHQDIGIASNAAEPLYVAVSNATGQPAVVVNDNPNAAQVTTWTKWVIPLQKFADQGINLTNVDQLAIGLGTPGNMTTPGGSGKMYFDDIRLERPAPVVNMLTNGGFEDGVLDPWYIYDNTGSGATATVVTDDPVEGNYCLHVVVPAAGTNFWDVGISQPGYVFQAGKKYTLSAWLKAAAGTTMQINFKPEHSADPWEGYGEQVITMTDQWVEYSVTTPVFTTDVSPANATFHVAFAAGEFWMDGVRLYEGDFVPSSTK